MLNVESNKVFFAAKISNFTRAYPIKISCYVRKVFGNYDEKFFHCSKSDGLVILSSSRVFK